MYKTNKFIIMKKTGLIILMCLLPGFLMAQSTFRTNLVVQKTAPVLYLKGTGGVIDFNSASATITHTSGTLTIVGANLSLGSNSLLLTGSVGATASRATKIWTTNLETTNLPTVNGVSLFDSPNITGTPTIAGYVPTSRLVNGYALTGNISLNAADVGLPNATNESKATMFTNPIFTGAAVKFNTDSLASQAYARAHGGGSGGGMVYPGAGIPLSVAGTSWGTSITDNSANWNTAYSWGNHAGLYLPIAGTAAKATILATARAIYGNDFNGSAALTQIIASTYGGTGNGFTKFTGPASTEKTFTLPNANATLARIDAGQTFTGHNTFEGITATGATGTGHMVFGTSPSFATGITTPAITLGATLLTATGSELNYVHNVTSAIQTQLNDKAPTASPTFTGTVIIPTPFTLGATSITTTAAQLNYINTLRSNAQQQFDDTINIGDVALLKHVLFSDQTTSYVLALTDDGKVVTMSNGSANTVTVPAAVTVNFPLGTQITIISIGTGQTSIVAAGTVTINSSGGALKLKQQNSVATLIKKATNTWYLMGELEN